MEPIDNRAGAFVVGLNHDTEAIPTGQLWVCQDGFNYIQRQIEAI